MTAARSLRAVERRTLHERAARTALEVRAILNAPVGDAVCVFDAAERLGVEVRFINAASLEGMYLRQAPGQAVSLIAISSLRPAGRQTWTAAHELGHHVFGHGDRIDDHDPAAATSVSASDDPKEVLANSFAAMFMMPRAAVERGFRVRGYSPSAPRPAEVYEVAGWLGVGYGTLITHMQWTLRMLGADEASALLAWTPKQIRAEIVSQPVSGDLWIASSGWTGRPVDVQVGDLILLPDGAEINGSALTAAARPDGQHIAETVAAGVAQVYAGDWAVFIRSAQREYHGRARYRHLEPAADEDLVDEEPRNAGRT